MECIERGRIRGPVALGTASGPISKSVKMRQIGKYTVIHPFLGGGGQAHIVEAEADGQIYALKLLTASPDDAEAVSRFDLEAEILRTIDHPNIVRYVDHGVDGSIRYIAMPRLPGRNLRFELAEHRQFSPYRAAGIARQLVLALQVFHQLGAVYRDLKPENIQLDDGSDHVWLLDAGYARYVRRTRITDAGARPPGTEGYRAPETLRGYDYKQSDFYALGIVLYEIITGRHPFDHKDPAGKRSISPVSRQAPDCPRFLAFAVDRLLAWEVRDRPQTAAEVLDLLVDPAHGLHAVERRELPWAEAGTPPLLFRITRANLAAIQDTAVSDVHPDAYLTTDRIESDFQTMLGTTKTDLIVDPELHKACYTGNESGSGFSATVCRPYKSRPLALDDLRDATSLRTIARLALDAESEMEASVPLVPGFVVTDTTRDGWLGCNTVLLDEFREMLPARDPFGIRVLISLEAAPTTMARNRLVEAVGRYRPDFFLLSFEGLGAKASAEQLLRALEIAHRLQQIACCVVCDAGAYQPFWLALGVGTVVDLTAEAPLATRANSWMPQRFAFPSILASLRLDDAERMLSEDVPESHCPCFACKSAMSIGEQLGSAQQHNAAMASRERAMAMSLAPTLRRAALQRRVEHAMQAEGESRIGRWDVRIARLREIENSLAAAEDRLSAAFAA
jgi:serine/threonine protein kinase